MHFIIATICDQSQWTNETWDAAASNCHFYFHLPTLTFINHSQMHIATLSLTLPSNDNSLIIISSLSYVPIKSFRSCLRHFRKKTSCRGCRTTPPTTLYQSTHWNNKGTPASQPTDRFRTLPSVKQASHNCKKSLREFYARQHLTR